MLEVCGAIHLHTTFSDGNTHIRELISIAKGIGLDFIVVTDHMTLQGFEERYEGFSDGLLVIIGYEHNDLNNKNHYLAIGTEHVIREQNSSQQYIHAVKNAGGIGFLAHPAEERSYFSKYPSYPWTDWNVTGFDGIELWNQMSEWTENLKSWRSFFTIFYPRRFLKGIPLSLLKRWDELNRRDFFSGIGGVDAHNHRITFGILSRHVFPTKVELKGVRTHLYVPDHFKTAPSREAKTLFLSALRDGRGFVSNYRRGDARGTKIFLYRDDMVIPPGRSTKSLALPVCLRVSLPEKSEIRLIKNGRFLIKSRSTHEDFEIKDSGLYRIEVFRKNKVWIYSNPFPIGNYPLY